MYVTYQDLIQIGILLVALADLIYQICKGRKQNFNFFLLVKSFHLLSFKLKEVTAYDELGRKGTEVTDERYRDCRSILGAK